MIVTIWTRESGEEMPKQARLMMDMFSPSLEEDITKIQACDCGEMRLFWEGDNRDPWKKHFDYVDHGDCEEDEDFAD